MAPAGSASCFMRFLASLRTVLWHSMLALSSRSAAPPDAAVAALLPAVGAVTGKQVACSALVSKMRSFNCPATAKSSCSWLDILAHSAPATVRTSMTTSKKSSSFNVFPCAAWKARFQPLALISSHVRCLKEGFLGPALPRPP